MKKFLAILVATLVGSFLIQSTARAVDLMTDVKAADALADLLTYAVDRTDTAAEAMQQYLQKIGKAEDFDKNRPAVSRPKRMDFGSVFKAAILFVQQGGDKFSDPSLKDHDQNQLLQDLTDLQTYNVQQFIHLNQQRDACDSMRAYLKSIGEFDNYIKWANQNSPVAAAVSSTTRPAADTPEQLAARMAALTQYARGISWKKAQARGMSESDFDAQWKKSVEQYKDTVADRVEGVRALGGSLAKSEIAGSKPQPTQNVTQAPVPQSTRINLGPIPPPAIWTAPPPIESAPPSLPPPVNSPDTDAHFRQLNNQNAWNPWDGQFYDGGVPMGN